VSNGGKFKLYGYFFQRLLRFFIERMIQKKHTKYKKKKKSEENAVTNMYLGKDQKRKLETIYFRLICLFC
jgi:hypothetical protein